MSERTCTLKDPQHPPKSSEVYGIELIAPWYTIHDKRVGCKWDVKTVTASALSARLVIFGWPYPLFIRQGIIFTRWDASTGSMDNDTVKDPQIRIDRHAGHVGVPEYKISSTPNLLAPICALINEGRSIPAPFPNWSRSTSLHPPLSRSRPKHAFDMARGRVSVTRLAPLNTKNLFLHFASILR